MPFEVRSKDNKFYVVDTATNSVRGRGYEDESDAEDRVDGLNFRAEVREKLGRMPVTEMTAEEKAAAYDKLMANKARESDNNIPPKNDPPSPKENPDKKRKLSYWGDVQNEG